MDREVTGEASVERLSFDAAADSSLSASEHAHRYRWASGLVRDLRVLDLCCGVGYGSAILAETARSVDGVDLSSEAIESARREVTADGVAFERGDALEVLSRDDLAESYDAIVCFEGLEHLSDLDAAVVALGRLAAAGVRLIASLPNSRTFGEDNPFHVTDPDIDLALGTFQRLPDAAVLLQYVAEGSLIVPLDGGEDLGASEIALLDRAEPEYANNYLAVCNVPGEELRAALHGVARLTLSPYYNRHLADLVRSNEELWRVNRRLGRQLRELTASLGEGDVREPAWQAIRQGQTSAGRTLAKVYEDRDRARAAQAAAEHRAWEFEMKLQEMGQRVVDLESEAAVGWGRYHELRNRRSVDLLLRATKRFGG